MSSNAGRIVRSNITKMLADAIVNTSHPRPIVGNGVTGMNEYLLSQS